MGVKFPPPQGGKTAAFNYPFGFGSASGVPVHDIPFEALQPEISRLAAEPPPGTHAVTGGAVRRGSGPKRRRASRRTSDDGIEDIWGDPRAPSKADALEYALAKNLYGRDKKSEDLMAQAPLGPCVGLGMKRGTVVAYVDTRGRVVSAGAESRKPVDYDELACIAGRMSGWQIQTPPNQLSRTRIPLRALRPMLKHR